MPESFSRLWNLDLAVISEAAHTWHGLSLELESAHTQHRKQVTVPLRTAGWSGEAATAAFGFLTGVENRMAIGQVEAETISTVLSSVHQRMEKARNDLRAVVAEAEGYGYTVSADGVVNPPPHTSRYEAEEGAAQLTGYRDRVTAALTAAWQASDDGRAALSILHGDVMGQYRQHPVNEAGLDAHDRPAIPRYQRAEAAEGHQGRRGVVEGAHPGPAARLHAAVPPAHRRLDGLPATVRDTANRLSLDEQLDNPEFTTGHDYASAAAP